VNQLVGFLTIGIYTPMSVVVTCAQSRSAASAEVSVELDRTASSRAQREAVTLKLESVGVGHPVLLVFE
jgi:hypothetical protein